MKVLIENSLSNLDGVKIPRDVLIAAFSKIITDLNSDNIILQRNQDQTIQFQIRISPVGINKEYPLNVILDYLGTLLKV